MKFNDVDHLLSSAADGDIESAKFFIEECNVDVNSTDDIGRTALHKAAGEGEDSIVGYLLSKGANVNPKIESNDPKLSGATPLAWAVMSGHVDTAKTLIQHGADTDVIVNNCNLLGIALMSDNPDMIDLILNYSTGIDEYDSSGRTPLLIALAGGKCESAQFLLEKGADYRKCSTNDLHPMLVIAIQEKKFSKGTELLLKHVEAKEGKDGVVEYINTIHFSSGRTALHLACLVQNYHTVKVLLERGADYKIKDKEGSRPSQLVIGDSHLSSQIRYLFGPYAQADLARSSDR